MRKLNEFGLNDLNPKQKKAIGMLVTGQHTQKEVAEAVRVSENTLSNWINNNQMFSAVYDAELALVDADRHRRYKCHAQRAVDKLVQLLNCGLPEIELKAAKEILDRAGDKATDKVEHSGHIDTTGKLDAILERMRAGPGDK